MPPTRPRGAYAAGAARRQRSGSWRPDAAAERAKVSSTKAHHTAVAKSNAGGGPPGARRRDGHRSIRRVELLRQQRRRSAGPTSLRPLGADATRIRVDSTICPALLPTWRCARRRAAGLCSLRAHGVEGAQPHDRIYVFIRTLQTEMIGNPPDARGRIPASTPHTSQIARATPPP